MPNDAVTVAYVHPNEIAESWHQSLLGLIAHDLGAHGRVARGGWLAIRCYGADGIAGARNTAVKQFLAEKDADWLLWIDTDMGFAPDMVDRLMEVAHPQERPIVGALCFAQKHLDPDGMGGYETAMIPTLYDWVTLDSGEQGFLSRRDYPANKVARCAGTGSACILIHRSVLEKMGEQYGTWYERVPNPTAGGKLLGEDLSFCMRAGAMNVPIHVHTGVRTTHFKPVWLSEQSFWRQFTAPPAVEETAVVVPALRYVHAERFMRSLKASTGLATAYAVAKDGEDDAAQTWADAGATVLWGSGMSFGERMNLGYSKTTEPWILLVGDDVEFRPGWLDHAQHVANTYGANAIGTNDLGRRMSVKLGQDSPHILLKRSYVDKVGASWDGPGVLCHEGYRHGYVDIEIALAAKQRGEWAMAFGAVIEHLHPVFGKADLDEVYEIGNKSAQADAAVFAERFKQYASGTVDEMKHWAYGDAS